MKLSERPFYMRFVYAVICPVFILGLCMPFLLMIAVISPFICIFKPSIVESEEKND